jgi:hypothetical protein
LEKAQYWNHIGGVAAGGTVLDVYTAGLLLLHYEQEFYVLQYRGSEHAQKH